MSTEEIVDPGLVKPRRTNFRNIALPPFGFVRSMVKPDAAELTRIGEDERARPLIQDEVVMPGRVKIFGFDMNPAGHSKMNAEPTPNGFASPGDFVVFIRKTKQHPFAARARIFEHRSNEIFAQRPGIGSAKHTIARVQCNSDNLRASTDVPLFAIPLDFGQFWHRGGYPSLQGGQRNAGTCCPQHVGKYLRLRRLIYHRLRRSRSTCTSCAAC